MQRLIRPVRACIRPVTAVTIPIAVAETTIASLVGEGSREKITGRLVAAVAVKRCSILSGGTPAEDKG